MLKVFLRKYPSQLQTQNSVIKFFRKSSLLKIAKRFHQCFNQQIAKIANRTAFIIDIKVDWRSVYPHHYNEQQRPHSSLFRTKMCINLIS